jgi:ribosomal protein S18 acetylase RimI-like enzyme
MERIEYMKVKRVDVSSVDFTQRIFDSLRSDYPGFDSWAELVQATSAHRAAFVATDVNGQYGAVALTKEETSSEYSWIPTPVLKISTFKVSADYSGQGLGKDLLNHAWAATTLAASYVEVLPHNQQAVDFFLHNGFMLTSERSTKGEVVLACLRAS